VALVPTRLGATHAVTFDLLLVAAGEVRRRGVAGQVSALPPGGEIRPDVGPTEVIRAIGGICMATDRPGSEETAIALVDLVFDGLRYGAPARS